MRRILLCLALLSLFATLPVPATAATAERYVPFIGERVPVSELRERVYITDASFRDYGAVEARKTFGLTGRGVEVCVIDTGVDATHEQLDTQLVAWVDFVNDRVKPYDDHGHGTHVSSIVLGDGKGARPAGRYRGVAPKAVLSVAKVLDAGGSGSLGQVIEGIQWCATRPSVDVISMSLSTRDASNGTDPLSAAANEAVNRGKVVVVAAGNSGPIPGSMGAPAAAENVITVGASSEWSGGKREERSFGPYLAPFSSRGPTVGGLLKPDIVAPGVTVKAAQAGGGYVAFSGTSMSAPYVAGTVAQMLQANSSLMPEQVKSILKSTALDLGKPGADGDWGAGLINSYSAAAVAEGVPGADIFPPHVTLIGSAPPGKSWSFPATGDSDEFIPTDLNQPIAATILFDPVPPTECITGCPEWPNFNVVLRAPAESLMVLDASMCPNAAPKATWCGYGASGRQETIGALPGTSARILPGYSHFLIVFPDTIATPSESRGATFTVDLFYR